MKRGIKVIGLLFAMVMLNGCIIHDGHSDAPHWGHNHHHRDHYYR